MTGWDNPVLCSPFQYVCNKCKGITGGYLKRVDKELKCSCGGEFVLDEIVINCRHSRLAPSRGEGSKYRRCLDCNSLTKARSGD